MSDDCAPAQSLPTAAEYEAAVAEIDRLLDLDAPHGSPEDERLHQLARLVEAYEDVHHPWPPSAAGGPGQGE